MSKIDTFTVSKKDSAGVVVSWSKPDGLADPEWHKRIAGDHKETVTLKVSKAVAAAVHELAVQSLVIKMQGSGREELGKGKAAVQAKIDRYAYGAKGSAPSTVVDATALGLSMAQIDGLTAAGATVINIPASLAGK